MHEFVHLICFAPDRYLLIGFMSVDVTWRSLSIDKVRSGGSVLPDDVCNGGFSCQLGCIINCSQEYVHTH